MLRDTAYWTFTYITTSKSPSWFTLENKNDKLTMWHANTWQWD